jgi:hypothetical protein
MGICFHEIRDIFQLILKKQQLICHKDVTVSFCNLLTHWFRRIKMSQKA